MDKTFLFIDKKLSFSQLQFQRRNRLIGGGTDSFVHPTKFLAWKTRNEKDTTEEMEGIQEDPNNNQCDISFEPESEQECQY